jgi:hypothetical protein
VAIITRTEAEITLKPGTHTLQHNVEQTQFPPKTSYPPKQKEGGYSRPLRTLKDKR